jgi:hypothetical protein
LRLHDDRSTHVFTEGEVWSMRDGAFRAISRFPFRYESPWSPDEWYGLRREPSGPIFAYARLHERGVTVRDLESASPIVEEHRLPPIDRVETRDGTVWIYLANGDRAELGFDGGRSTGGGTCGVAYRDRGPCTPAPITIDFEGTSAVVRRSDDWIAVGSAWHDQSDAVYQRPRCGNDTRPEGYARGVGHRGRGELEIARVSRYDVPRRQLLPIETTYNSEVIATADSFDRVHVLVRRAPNGAYATRVTEYVRLGCGN